MDVLGRSGRVLWGHEARCWRARSHRHKFIGPGGVEGGGPASPSLSLPPSPANPLRMITVLIAKGRKEEGERGQTWSLHPSSHFSDCERKQNCVHSLLSPPVQCKWLHFDLWIDWYLTFLLGWSYFVAPSFTILCL